MVLNDVLNFLEKKNCKNTLLVTGKNSFKTSGAEKLFGKIESSHKLVRFSDFTENPKIEDVEKGVNVYNENRCDSIISIGGGSVIDMAKLISCLTLDESVEYLKNLNFNRKYKRTSPFLVIPTTAGSGSEATSFAVIYINGIKYSLQDDSLLPDDVILEPTFSFSASSQQKSISGLDAFSQSIESYWSRNSTNESREYSLKALDLIWNNLYDSITNNSLESHKNVLIGSYYAGKAINIAKTTAPHALSYYFTSNHGIKHGQAVSLTLSKIYSFNESKVTKEDKHNTEIFNNLNRIMGIEKGKSKDVINRFIKSLGIEIEFSKLNININNEINNILKSVNEERLKNNPFKIDIEGILTSK